VSGKEAGQLSLKKPSSFEIEPLLVLSKNTVANDKDTPVS
jgi:hypothetical protein